MYCGAPGQSASGGLRQVSLNRPQVSVSQTDRYLWTHPCYPGKGSAFLPERARGSGWYTFTRQFSGLWVEHGRLGEVVSLVGDCRPPPPGNPRRPVSLRCRSRRLSRQRSGTASAVKKGDVFTLRMGKYGGIFTSIEAPSSLYKQLFSANLKELNISQYFKKDCSYISCTGNDPVLKFWRVHYHLCGLKVVGPPPIAITNVLRNR
jgi:hypothetical protein